MIRVELEQFCKKQSWRKLNSLQYIGPLVDDQKSRAIFYINFTYGID